MKYFVDTDWAIHHLRGSQTVTEQLKQRAADGIAISIISAAELYHGVFGSRNPELAEANLLSFLSDIEVIGLNDDISRLFGEHRAHMQLQLTPIGDFDLLIGCTALHHNLTALTDDRRDFQLIDQVRVETQ